MTSIKDDDTTYLTTVTVLLLLHSSVFVRVALVEVVVTLVTSGSGYIGRSDSNSSGVYSDNSHGTGRRIYSGCFSGISNGGGSDSSKCFSNAYTC